jgi:hypothetical protein
VRWEGRFGKEGGTLLETDDTSSKLLVCYVWLLRRPTFLDNDWLRYMNFHKQKRTSVLRGVTTKGADSFLHISQQFQFESLLTLNVW